MKTESELTVEQQLEYNSDPLLYIDGSLVWDELTNEQKTLFSKNVFFIPNKSFDEEALDGKNRRYVDLLKNRVIKIHKLYLEIPNPGRLATVPFIYREYNPNEYFVYNEEGGVTLFPAVAMIEAINASPMYYGAGHGGAVPALPQVLHIDYTYGIEEIPEDLIDAIALLTAVKVFETVNICYTQGLLSFSVQGFSAAFGDGLYVKIMERFRDMAENTLIAHTQSFIRGGW